MTQATGTFSGTNPPKCILQAPTRNAVTFSQERDRDGFPFKLFAETGSQRLEYTFRCNGARATIHFSHPQRVQIPNSPAIAPNSRYFTSVSVSNPTGAFHYKDIKTLQPSTSAELVLPASSYTSAQTMSVGFAIRSGADANIPFLAGNYQFKFTATIEAGLQ